jgi:hypothetical protein
LVKAFPQPSHKYEETVCCAGVSLDTGEFLRLYPIRYRRLPDNKRFNRFDLVEMHLTKARDGRPESYRVEEDSINIIECAKDKSLSAESKFALWQPFVYRSLTDLEFAQKEKGTSLGIIKPENVSFHHEPINEADEEDQQLLKDQASLFEEPLKKIVTPEYNFFYHFNSGEKLHKRTIQDWEVQAAYHKFKRKYGPDKVLEKVEEQYANRIPQQNLHFVMGTMAKRKWQFILIGLLRTPVESTALEEQGKLF